jgi:hypothetical protein
MGICFEVKFPRENKYFYDNFLAPLESPVYLLSGSCCLFQ